MLCIFNMSSIDYECKPNIQGEQFMGRREPDKPEHDRALALK